MSCSDIKYRGIHYGMVMASIKVSDEGIYILDLWCIWRSSIAKDTVEGIYKIRLCIFHHMYNFPICALNFPR